MSQIGPQMPSHLAKRKRTPEDGDGGDKTDGRRVRHASPRTFGPTMPPGPDPDEAAEPRAVVAGPTMPPQATQNEDEIALDGSDDDDDGPTLPPPPAPDSDSDSDYGPALPGAALPTHTTPTVTAPYDNVSDDDTQPPAGPATDAPIQRDDWMLAPPTDDTARTADPTKIRARKFATGRAAAAVDARAAGGGGAASSAIGSLWTETVEQRSRRLADTVLGRAPDPRQGGARAAAAAATTTTSSSSSSLTKRDQANEAEIMAYTEATRGRSLYEMHQESLREGRKQGEKEGSRRGRERSKDRAREREGDRDRDRDRHRDRDRDRDRDKDRDRHPDRRSDKHGERSERHRDRDRDRDRGRHRSDRHRGHDHDRDTAKSAQEEDDPSARAFDREKDMALGGQINNKQRRDLVSRASNFSGRFQKGNYL